MGGATPTYGLESAKEGEDLADELWDVFGGGKSNKVRPFGTAIADGFDLDIENGAKVGYTAFVNKMRQNYEMDRSKTYYIAAAPQCPFPLNAQFIFRIQFYNNYCNVISDNGFNYQVWDSWAKTKSLNKNVRLFIGIPGSPTAAGRGYVPFTELVSKITPLKSSSFFGGLMVWDISQAYANTGDVLPNYASGIARLIKGNNNTYGPVELAPITIQTKTSTTMRSSTETLSSSSSLPLQSSSSISSADSVLSSTITSSLSHSMRTLTLKRNVTTTSTQLVVSVLLDQPYESVITDDQMTTYTPLLSSLSTTVYDSATIPPEARVTTSPSPELPIAGQPCDKQNRIMCSDNQSFAQCSLGRWVIRRCSNGTVCREDSTLSPPIVYCGYP